MLDRKRGGALVSTWHLPGWHSDQSEEPSSPFHAPRGLLWIPDSISLPETRCYRLGTACTLWPIVSGLLYNFGMSQLASVTTCTLPNLPSVWVATLHSDSISGGRACRIATRQRGSIGWTQHFISPSRPLGCRIGILLSFSATAHALPSSHA